MDKLNSPVIPGTSCFCGTWREDVRAGQFIVLDDFVGRSTWLASAPASVAVSPMSDSA